MIQVSNREPGSSSRNAVGPAFQVQVLRLRVGHRERASDRRVRVTATRSRRRRDSASDSQAPSHGQRLPGAGGPARARPVTASGTVPVAQSLHELRPSLAAGRLLGCWPSESQFSESSRGPRSDSESESESKPPPRTGSRSPCHCHNATGLSLSSDPAGGAFTLIWPEPSCQRVRM